MNLIERTRQFLRELEADDTDKTDRHGGFGVAMHPSRSEAVETPQDDAESRLNVIGVER